MNRKIQDAAIKSESLFTDAGRPSDTKRWRGCRRLNTVFSSKEINDAQLFDAGFGRGSGHFSIEPARMDGR